MRIRNLGILSIFAVLILVFATNTEAAACTPSSCTPTCSWVFPSSDNMDLETVTSEGNTTMVALVQEATTSGFYNITMYTISPYRNATTSQNSTQGSLGPVTFSDLDDGTYRINATIFYDNGTLANGSQESSYERNLTVTQVACSARYFTVETTEGGIKVVQAQAIAAEDVSKKVVNVGIVLVLIAGVYVLFLRKK